MINAIAGTFCLLPLTITIVRDPWIMFPLNILIYLSVSGLIYPFETAFKRLVCQHNKIPGMIPQRYILLHADTILFGMHLNLCSTRRELEDSGEHFLYMQSRR